MSTYLWPSFPPPAQWKPVWHVETHWGHSHWIPSMMLCHQGNTKQALLSNGKCNTPEHTLGGNQTGFQKSNCEFLNVLLQWSLWIVTCPRTRTISHNESKFNASTAEMYYILKVVISWKFVILSESCFFKFSLRACHKFTINTKALI